MKRRFPLRAKSIVPPPTRRLQPAREYKISVPFSSCQNPNFDVAAEVERQTSRSLLQKGVTITTEEDYLRGVMVVKVGFPAIQARISRKLAAALGWERKEGEP